MPPESATRLAFCLVHRWHHQFDLRVSPPSSVLPFALSFVPSCVLSPSLVVFPFVLVLPLLPIAANTRFANGCSLKMPILAAESF